MERDIFKEFSQRRGGLVHANEDEAVPFIHPHLRQAELAPLHLWEIPLARNLERLAIQLPTEPVIGTAQRRGVSVCLMKLAPTMQAGIVKRLYRQIGLTHNQD